MVGVMAQRHHDAHRYQTWLIVRRLGPVPGRSPGQHGKHAAGHGRGVVAEVSMVDPSLQHHLAHHVDAQTRFGGAKDPVHILAVSETLVERTDPFEKLSR